MFTGLNERLTLVNQHPFYDREQFASPEDYESWKIFELSAVERQKQVSSDLEESPCRTHVVLLRCL